MSAKIKGKRNLEKVYCDNCHISNENMGTINEVVELCPIHAAAPKMLALLKEGIEGLTEMQYRDWKNRVEDVIAEVEGKERK